MKKLTAAKIIKAALCFTMAATLTAGVISNSSDTVYGDDSWDYCGYTTGEKSYSEPKYSEDKWFYNKFYPNYIVGKIGKTTDGKVLNQTNVEFDSSGANGDELITWNRINSEEDYKEFIEATKTGSGVKLLLVFQDLENGSWNVIGGSNWTSSTNYLEGVIRVWGEDSDMPFASDMFNRCYWMMSQTGVNADGTGTYENVVQQLDTTTDGLSGLTTGADQVVTYGGACSFTAVADTSTADPEDFYLITDQEEIEGLNQSESGNNYLVCRQGAPRWNWGNSGGWWGAGYNAQIILPQLETSKSTSNPDETIADSDYNIHKDIACHDVDHVHSTITCEVKSSWKLGAYCKDDDSTQADWENELYICQQGEAAYMLENRWSEDTRDTFPGTIYRNMYRTPYSYSYAVLSAQNHKGIAMLTASEWISKKAISEYSDPKALYYNGSVDWEDRVVGGLLFNAPGYEGDGCDRTIYRDNIYELNAGFYIYYAAEGVSRNAIDSSYTGGNAAGNASMTDNVAQVTYIYSSDKTLTSGQTLTIQKNTVTIVPKGNTITVDEGASLIVSEGAVLVLNGGILNHGTILVQPGGMILRYCNADDTSVLIKDGNTLVPDNITDSCIVCDGGNMLVRSNGRIRVSSLAVSMSPGTSSGSTSSGSTSTEAAETTTKTTKDLTNIKGFTSDTQSTLLNYGFILSDCYVFEEGSTIINEGTLSNGNTYTSDLLTGVSYETLKNTIGTSPTYDGVRLYYTTPVNKNGGTYTE